MSNVQIHRHYDNPNGQAGLTPDLLQILSTRQGALKRKLAGLPKTPGLTKEEDQWLGRSYPILAILAPVMSTHEEKIEFPGDPMCLYGALTVSVEQAVKARQEGLVDGGVYNDYCPRWGEYPTAEYRREAADGGIRHYSDGLSNTDQTIFDPRVWNEEIKQFFIKSILMKMKPRVILISAVSPAHRYALEIARTIRQHLPECIIVLGGRHTDETIHYEAVSGEMDFKPTSIFHENLLKDTEGLIDFAISGQGYYALDLLLKVISLSMDIETGSVSVPDIINNLADYSPMLNPSFRGYALLISRRDDQINVWVLSGGKVSLHELPPPYRAFAIRARFPIFHTDGHVSRTAHFMVTNSCPYHCFFCSESSVVVGQFISFGNFGDSGIRQAIERMVEYVEYGAEAVFFDDSIFWGGNPAMIVNFCREWIKIRKTAEMAETDRIQVFGRDVKCTSILNLAWGAQFTVDILASRKDPDEAAFILQAMREAGCTYLYIGIESLADDVIKHVHKNLRPNERWDDRVRKALGMAREAGLRVGSSVLFGLEGETPETISETVSKVEELLAEDLLFIASPNILTYHPNTEITRLHGMEDRIDYHSANLDNRPPYRYFEEAFPAVVSKRLTEDAIWHIHQETRARWGNKRNLNPMPRTVMEE